MLTKTSRLKDCFNEPSSAAINCEPPSAQEYSTSAKILDGNALAASIRNDLRAKGDALTASGRRALGLAVILVGDDSASSIYVNAKKRDCREVNYHSDARHLSPDISQAGPLEIIDELNRDTQIDGILVQLPLPDHIDPLAIMDAIDPNKDVDGFHPYNVGRRVVFEDFGEVCILFHKVCSWQEMGRLVLHQKSMFNLDSPWQVKMVAEEVMHAFGTLSHIIFSLVLEPGCQQKLTSS